MKKVFNAFANRKFALVFAMLIICSASAFAQDISAGQNAMTQVTNEIQQYLPLVVNLCYALAGIFAVVGAVSVYIAMNNEEQDVKNILVLKKWRESTRKQMKVNSLSLNYLCGFLTFPILAKMTLKKI